MANERSHRAPQRCGLRGLQEALALRSIAEASPARDAGAQSLDCTLREPAKLRVARRRAQVATHSLPAQGPRGRFGRSTVKAAPADGTLQELALRRQMLAELVRQTAELEEGRRAARTILQNRKATANAPNLDSLLVEAMAVPRGAGSAALPSAGHSRWAAGSSDFATIVSSASGPVARLRFASHFECGNLLSAKLAGTRSQGLEGQCLPCSTHSDAPTL